MKKYLTTCLLFTVTFISPITAVEETQSSPSVHDLINNHESQVLPQEDAPRDFYGDFIHMLVILGVMVTFLVLATWALKRLQATRLQGSNKDSLIKVLETRNLSSRSAIHFIEILNKGIIIGESHAGLVRLAEMPLDADEESIPTSS